MKEIEANVREILSHPIPMQPMTRKVYGNGRFPL
jgi:hypothetical protein